MKKQLSLIAFLFSITFTLYSQENIKLTELDTNTVYIFETNDGAEISGKLISFDAKEVLVESISMGEIAIPKYQIRSIREANDGDISATGKVLKDNIFATRYFITTNGLPIKKGDSYVLLNWYGPDVQFGVADHLSLGVMTSWIGTPIIGTIKYSQQIDDKSSFGVGALVGTLGWADLGIGGALPFLVYSYGDRKNNINLSLGFGATWTDGFTGGISSEGLLSVAGMTRLTNSVSLVFDTFIVPGFGVNNETPFTALIIPGIRIQNRESIALQLGFTGIYSEEWNEGDGGFVPLPIPMVQLFWKF
jgi:hypothetical protein